MRDFFVCVINIFKVTRRLISYNREKKFTCHKTIENCFRVSRSEKIFFSFLPTHTQERNSKKKMKTGFVYRKGRTRRVTEAERKGRAACANNFCIPLIVDASWAERSICTNGENLVLQQEAFEMVEDSVVLNNGWVPRA